MLDILSASRKTENGLKSLCFHHDEEVHDFISALECDFDPFINFDMGGLVFFCSKGTFYGFYSPGNSLDIVQLLDMIESTVKASTLKVYDFIYKSRDKDASLYSIFKRSYEVSEKVKIV